MPDVRALLLFVSAAVALNITPGPDMLYVAARSTSEGRSAGIASALGIAAGCLVHISAVALGLSALLIAVPVAYTVVRVAGGAYLVYLGARALLTDPSDAERALKPASLAAIFRQGAVTNILNPKVALFFLAFLPQFVDPARGRPTLQIVALGLLFNTSGTIVNVAVALGASRAADRLRSGRLARTLHKITGAIFIALGLRIALSAKR